MPRSPPIPTADHVGRDRRRNATPRESTASIRANLRGRASLLNPNDRPRRDVQGAERRRSGSASRSISAIRPPAIVKPATASTRSGVGDDEPGRAVDHRRAGERGESAKVDAWRATSSAPRVSTRERAAVDADHDVGVQDRDQRLEVAVAGGGEERVDDRALRGRGRCPAPGRRRARAGGRGWRAGGRRPGSDRRSARSGRTAPRTCRAGRTRAARPGRASRARPAARARPSRPAAPAARARRRTIGSGTRDAQRLLAPRVARAQHVERDPRDDGRQPAAEVLDPSASERLSRSHASWTASSASLTEPSMRYATARSCGRLASKRSASQSLRPSVTSLRRVSSWG